MARSTNYFRKTLFSIIFDGDNKLRFVGSKIGIFLKHLLKKLIYITLDFAKWWISSNSILIFFYNLFWHVVCFPVCTGQKMLNLKSIFMKTYLTLLIALVIGTSAKASINHSATAPFGHGDSVIFTENGITFSVFPNGEFDFYLNNHVNVNANVNVGNVNLTMTPLFNMTTMLR